MVPLLLQDRESIATDFILGSPAVQAAVISWLDSVLGEASPSYTCRQYVLAHKIDQVKYEKLDSKPLTKLVNRLTQRFQMNVMECPNVGKRKRTGALRHLMYRKFDKQEQMCKSKLFCACVSCTKRYLITKQAIIYNNTQYLTFILREICECYACFR